MGRALTIEEKRKKYRKIFEILHEKPRIYPKEASKRTDMKQNILGQKMKEALKGNYIVGPCLKKKSYNNLREYMYFFKCENPRKTYLEYIKDENIVYHAVMDGFCDLWTISKEKFDVDGEVIAEGFPTDYHVSFPPDWQWNVGFEFIRKMIKVFNPGAYTPKYILKNYWNETVEWTEIDEILYREFKYDFRRPVSPIMKKHNIQRSIINSWLKRIPECCDIFTYYYPESMGAYDPYLYLFETNYEDFLIEIFSQLPTSALFFKIKEKLFAHLFIDRQFLRNIDSKKPDFTQLHIPLIIEDLLGKKIIERVSRAFVAYHWRKNL